MSSSLPSKAFSKRQPPCSSSPPVAVDNNCSNNTNSRSNDNNNNNNSKHQHQRLTHHHEGTTTSQSVSFTLVSASSSSSRPKHRHRGSNANLDVKQKAASSLTSSSKTSREVVRTNQQKTREEKDLDRKRRENFYTSVLLHEESPKVMNCNSSPQQSHDLKASTFLSAQGNDEDNAHEETASSSSSSAKKTNTFWDDVEDDKDRQVLEDDVFDGISSLCSSTQETIPNANVASSPEKQDTKNGPTAASTTGPAATTSHHEQQDQPKLQSNEQHADSPLVAKGKDSSKEYMSLYQETAGGENDFFDNSMVQCIMQAPIEILRHAAAAASSSLLFDSSKSSRSRKEKNNKRGRCRRTHYNESPPSSRKKQRHDSSMLL